MQFGESKKSTDLLEIDPFTQAFYEIDQDGDGVISKTDLENFVRLNNLGDDTLVKVMLFSLVTKPYVLNCITHVEIRYDTFCLI